DVASITGTNAGGAVEDGAAITGQLSVSDVDAGQAFVQAQSGVAGSYGSFAIDADGAWTYTINNSLAAVQALNAGEQVTETFTVTSADGTATKDVVVTVTGVNDAASISGTASGAVGEDAVLSTGGVLTVGDVDAGQAQVQAQTGVAGAYGSFSIDADGNWTYTLDNANAAVQALTTGEQVTDTFTVTSADGSATQDVVVTIDGQTENRAPVAVNDTAYVGAPAGTLMIRFEYGQYDYQSDVDGNYVGVTQDGFLFAKAAVADTEGADVTDWYGSNWTNALYSTIPGQADAPIISMTRLDGNNFSFASANYTGYYLDTDGSFQDVVLTETVTGYRDGLVVAQQVFNVTELRNNDYIRNNAVSMTGAAWADVDRVDFSLGAAAPVGSVPETVYQFLDNLVVAGAGAHVLSVDIDAVANDTDEDGDALTVSAFSATSALGATVSLNLDGTFHYDPTALAAYQSLGAGQVLTDTFTYSVQDTSGLVSNTATVAVTLHGINDAPVANDDSVSTTVSGGGAGQVLTFTGIVEDYFAGPGDVLLSSVTEGDYYITNASPDLLLMQNGPAIGYGADLSEAIWSHTTNVFDGVQTPEVSLVRNDGADFSLYSVRSAGYFYDFDGGNVGATLTQHVVGYNDGVMVGQMDVTIVNGGDSAVISFAGQAWAASVDHVDFFLDATVDTPLTNGYMESFLDDITFGTVTPPVELDIDALLNDSDIDAGTSLGIGAFSATSALGGTITQNPDGTFHYLNQLDVAPGTSVYDTFTYQTIDELGALSNVATVGITIAGV
ncbi:MAG: hypothetical protein RLZZ271_93, partial [Pseudomonadota bacterium]